MSKRKRLTIDFASRLFVFLPFMALTYLESAKDNVHMWFKDVKNRNPVFASGFHARHPDSYMKRSQSRIAAICELLVEKDFTL